jgi:hypothetical protein
MPPSLSHSSIENAQEPLWIPKQAIRLSPLDCEIASNLDPLEIQASFLRFFPGSP